MTFAWAPTPEKVAAVIRARVYGNELDATSALLETWDDSTRPTLNQVVELIDLACGDLVALMGGRAPCTSDLELAAGTAATYRVAMLIEAGYKPEQTQGDSTAFAAFSDLWESASEAVASTVVNQCPLPDIPGVTPSDDGVPVGRVPDGPLIGRGTCW